MTEERTKNVEEISTLAYNLANSILKKKVETVLEVTAGTKGWKVVVEVLERKAIPDTQDILGMYEFEIDSNGKLLGYKQVMLRRRSEVKSASEE